ncbi:MAG: restriction endonuclease subunit S [Eubacterium sp.]
MIELNNLVRSRFVELFGECRKRVFLNDLCSIITDGTHQPPKFQSDGVPFIFVSNLARDIITYDTEKYISAETYLELYKRTPIEIGDVLLSTVGSYGHPAVVTEAKKFLFQRHIAYLKPKHDIVNSFFLHSALLSPDGQRQIKEKVKGIAQKTLNLSEIRKIEIPLPELQKQNQFADFAHQVDKSKFRGFSMLTTMKSAYEQQTLIYP